MNNRLQKIQNITAGYVYSRYASIQDVIKLNWLPIREYMDFNTVKLVHKSRLDKNHPTYLNVEFAVPRRILRSASNGPMDKHGITGTFQEQARCYNELPSNIKLHKSQKKFNIEAKKYYLNKALARALSDC